MNAEFLPGLPGTGPESVHLHGGHSTYWSEGVVLRIEPDIGQSWIANLQKGYVRFQKILPWPTAKKFVVIARGATYTINPEAPADWRFVDLNGTDCQLTPDEHSAVIATYGEVIALQADGRVRWERQVALCCVEIEFLDNDVVSGRAEVYPENWQPFALRMADGLDVS